jgi:hypothetical protein
VLQVVENTGQISWLGVGTISATADPGGMIAGAIGRLGVSVRVGTRAAWTGRSVTCISFETGEPHRYSDGTTRIVRVEPTHKTGSSTKLWTRLRNIEGSLPAEAAVTAVPVSVS